MERLEKMTIEGCYTSRIYLRTWTIHAHYTRAISDTGVACTTGRILRQRMATELYVHCQRCPCTSVPRSALTARYGAASESRAGQRVPTLPHMQPLRALSQEQRSGLSEGQGGGRDRDRGRGHLCGATEAGGEDTRHSRESCRREIDHESHGRVLGWQGVRAMERGFETRPRTSRAVEKR